MSDRTPPPQPTRQYLFSEGHIRLAFTGITILMLAALVFLLLLSTARPRGRYTQVDSSQHEATVQAAAADLTGFAELENGMVRLDIDRAIELVAERGVVNPFSATAQAQADTAGDAAAAEGDVAEGAAAGLPDGAGVYGNCSACHGQAGQGVPGAFPPLADGHAADLYAADPTFLAQVTLFGMQGPIEVDGMTYNGLMPAWGNLSDAQIAAVLNYVLTSWGNDVGEEQPYDAEFIAEQRDQNLNPQQVHQIRQELELP